MHFCSRAIGRSSLSKVQAQAVDCRSRMASSTSEAIQESGLSIARCDQTISSSAVETNAACTERETNNQHDPGWIQPAQSQSGLANKGRSACAARLGETARVNYCLDGTWWIQTLPDQRTSYEPAEMLGQGMSLF